MRKPEYLSPSSISIFYSNPDEFYLQYIADNRPKRMPQTKPMSIGSAFDAYVKADLHNRLFGKTDPRFEFDNLFVAQVEPHNRDWAREHGKYVYDTYVKFGVLKDLMSQLSHCVGKPRFEFEVKGVVSHDGRKVKLLGRPDCFYINDKGAHVILDFKVNGYCSNSAISPMPGYVKLYPTMQSHKNAFLMKHEGITINAGEYLENLNDDWARQLSIYAWLCGDDVGDKFITVLHQICCSPGFDKPSLRVAEHALRVKKDWQMTLFDSIVHAWDVIESDHFFRDLSKEDSLARAKMLDGQAEVLKGDGSTKDNWFSDATRG